MDTRFVELMQSARVLVEDCMLLKEGDEALVVTDTRISEYYGMEQLYTALVAAIRSVGAEPVVISCTPRQREGDEFPALVRNAMKSADAIFTLPTQDMLQTKANNEAIANGARLMALPCGDDVNKLDDMIYRLMPRNSQELKDLAELTSKAGERFKKGKEVHFTTKKGTDLTMKIGELKMFVNTGIMDHPGMLQFAPTGQLAVGITPGSANGKIVFDASIYPLRTPLEEPIVMTVKDGMVTDITGGAQAEEYKKLIEAENNPNAYSVVEIGLGTNPRAKIVAEALEDERYYGSGHIGIGGNAAFGGDIVCQWHSDGIIYDATMEIDGELLMKEGEFLV